MSEIFDFILEISLEFEEIIFFKFSTETIVFESKSKIEFKLELMLK